MDGIPLLDIAAEDDLLLPCPSKPIGCLENHGECIGEEIPQRKRRVPDMYNLRKSLAWDSAFFTSEGVLNTEELAIINGASSNVGQHPLGGIQEECCRSSGSCSKLSSEDMMLENLVIDGHCIEETQDTSACNKAHSSRNVDPKAPVASMRCPVSRQGRVPKTGFDSQLNKVIVENGVHKVSQRPPRSALGTQGARKGIVSTQAIHVKNKIGNSLHGCTHVIPSKKVDANQPSIAIFKSYPAKKASSCSMTTGQSASLVQSGSTICSSNQINKPSLGHCKVVSQKKPATGQSASVVPGVFSAKRASPLSTPNKKQQMASPAHSGSCSNSSDQLSLSSLDKSHKRSTVKNCNRSTSTFHDRFIKVSAGKSISRSTSNNTSTPRSIFGFFSSGSPSRSMDSLGSMSSSSSTSMGRKRVGSKIPEHSSSAHPRTSSESSGSRSNSITDKNGERSHCKGNSRGQESKPSGLRIPTPKIGYFDADKLASGNSPGCIRRILQSGLVERNSGSDLSVVRKTQTSLDRSPASMSMDSRVTGASSASRKKLPEDIKISTFEVGTSLRNEVNSFQLIEQDQVSEIGVKCCDNNLNFPEPLNSSKTTSIIDSHPGKSSFLIPRSFHKENSLSLSGNSCCSSTESNARGSKVTTIDQLEKRLTSLKLSLSVAAENARDLVPFLEKSILVSEKVESLQSTLNSLSINPEIFGSLPRTPLSDANY